MEYKEIFRLKKMLEEANIPFEFTDDLFYVKDKVGRGGLDYIMFNSLYPAYEIKIYKNGAKEERICDVIQHCGSRGNKQDLLEIMGGLTKAEQECYGVIGYLTAEEVFKRFKQCYENGCSTYKNLEKE
jgi:hypothetical protein